MDGSDPNVLFARYLSFLSDRDYQGALDSLHQYHDVLSPRRNSRPVGSDGDGSSSSSAGGAGLHFRGSGIQYAALNLAGLQLLFDHCNAAQDSIQEAIRVAQHHGDHICVAFALAWLFALIRRWETPRMLSCSLLAAA
ncbi:Anaphase-promoting complex subunit 5 [Phytophthora cactorum]|nr:Anaphase-promoting complex subunit 5 [Phytophthora cactorum]